MPGQTYWWKNDYRSHADWTRHGQDSSGSTSCPGVFIGLPRGGSTIAGTVTVNAYAAGEIAVQRLQLNIDGHPVTTSSTAIYMQPRTSTQAACGVAYKWDTTQLKNGIHIVQANASDATGHSSSASIEIRVNNR